jgi:hypothetical protein
MYKEGDRPDDAACVNRLRRAATWNPWSRAEVEWFFAGMEIVPSEGAEPAVTHLGVWAAEDPELADSDGSHW